MEAFRHATDAGDRGREDNKLLKCGHYKAGGSLGRKLGMHIVARSARDQPGIHTRRCAGNAGQHTVQGHVVYMYQSCTDVPR